eukprot:2827188-Amphidinium_carterae.1
MELLPALHKAQDQGAIGWLAGGFLDSYLGVRGATFEDEAHRYHGNDLRNALKRAGMWICVLERAHVYNCRTAPW